MNLKIAFPMWTEDTDSTNGNIGRKNRGELATNVIKLTIGIRPIASDYIGFYVPRMKPFMKSTGGNEIDVVTSRKSVFCWYYGTEDGKGWVRNKRIDTIPAAGAARTSLSEIFPYVGSRWQTKYAPLQQMARSNFVVCRLGTQGSSPRPVAISIPVQQVGDATETHIPANTALLINGNDDSVNKWTNSL
jgi:hypothetical protein